jgi:septal ring factor EnvC (AmiA/AmiB activator)
MLYQVKKKKIRRNLERKEKEIKRNKKKVNGLKIEMHRVQLKTDQLTGKLEKARNENSKYARDFKKHLDYYCIKRRRFNISQQLTPVICEVDNAGYVEQKLIEQPAEKFCRTEKNVKEISSLKAKLDLERKNLSKLKGKVSAALSEYIKQRKKQLSSLKKVKLSKKNKQELLTKKQKEKEKLSSLVLSLKTSVKNMERLKAIAKNFEAAKGRLPWPVEGKLITRFGRQKHSSLDAYVYNRGIELSVANSNSIINSVAGGEVVYAGDFEGLGNMVVIDHGNDYYTIYGKLGQISVQAGTEVEVLDNLGQIDSGILYFELGNGSKPQNPVVWLQKNK